MNTQAEFFPRLPFIPPLLSLLIPAHINWEQLLLCQVDDLIRASQEMRDKALLEEGQVLDTLNRLSICLIKNVSDLCIEGMCPYGRLIRGPDPCDVPLVDSATIRTEMDDIGETVAPFLKGDESSIQNTAYRVGRLLKHDFKVRKVREDPFDPRNRLIIRNYWSPRRTVY